MQPFSPTHWGGVSRNPSPQHPLANQSLLLLQNKAWSSHQGNCNPCPFLLPSSPAFYPGLQEGRWVQQCLLRTWWGGVDSSEQDPLENFIQQHQRGIFSVLAAKGSEAFPPGRCCVSGRPPGCRKQFFPPSWPFSAAPLATGASGWEERSTRDPQNISFCLAGTGGSISLGCWSLTATLQPLPLWPLPVLCSTASFQQLVPGSQSLRPTEYFPQTQQSLFESQPWSSLLLGGLSMNFSPVLVRWIWPRP